MLCLKELNVSLTHGIRAPADRFLPVTMAIAVPSPFSVPFSEGLDEHRLGQLLGREGLPLRGGPIRAVQPRLVVRTGAAAHEDARLGRAVVTATTAVAIRTAKVFVGELRRERSGRWVQNLPKVGLQVLNLRAASHGHARAAVLRVAVATEVVIAVRSTVLVELAPQQAVVGLSKHQRRVRGACRILQVLLVL